MKSATQQPDNTNTLKKLSTALLYLAIFIQWVMLFLISWRELPFSFAWKIEDWSFSRSRVIATKIDQHGEPWLIADTTGNDIYQLRHVTKDGTVSWDLPFLTLEDAIFTSILQDQNNNPWLILGKRLAHWDGNQWNFTPMPLDADIKDVIPPTVVIKDAMVWGIDMTPDKHRIIKLDLNQDPIQAGEILLPDGLESQQYKFNCIISTPSGLLAVLSNEEQVAIYQLQDDKWQRITSFVRNKQASNVFVSDVAIDSKDQIWVLLQSRPALEKPVGRYDPIEKRWIWLGLEQPEHNIRFLEYGHIAFDAFDRVWLFYDEYGTTFDFISSSLFHSYVIGVYEEIPDDKLALVRYYSSRNSSLQTSSLSRIAIGPDGKIWTWNQQLVWMDGNQKELPKPLPNWFIFLTENKILLLIVSIILLVVYIFVQVRIQKYKLAGLAKKE